MIIDDIPSSWTKVIALTATIASTSSEDGWRQIFLAVEAITY